MDKNGFADGAYARWRSLYELNVVSEFISENGEKTAKAYLDAADRPSTERSYEWAKTAKCMQKKNYVSFGSIQKSCKNIAPEWIKEYDFANQLVHASAQGTLYRIGGKTTDSIPVGRTNLGVGISAIHAAISLAEITRRYFSIFHYTDNVIAMLTFHKWIDKIAQHYKEAEQKLLEDK